MKLSITSFSTLCSAIESIHCSFVKLCYSKGAESESEIDRPHKYTSTHKRAPGLENLTKAQTRIPQEDIRQGTVKSGAGPPRPWSIMTNDTHPRHPRSSSKERPEVASATNFTRDDRIITLLLISIPQWLNFGSPAVALQATMQSTPCSPWCKVACIPAPP